MASTNCFVVSMRDWTLYTDLYCQTLFSNQDGLKFVIFLVSTFRVKWNLGLLQQDLINEFLQQLLIMNMNRRKLAIEKCWILITSYFYSLALWSERNLSILVSSSGKWSNLPHFMASQATLFRVSYFVRVYF